MPIPKKKLDPKRVARAARKFVEAMRQPVPAKVVLRSMKAQIAKGFAEADSESGIRNLRNDLRDIARELDALLDDMERT